MITTTPLTRSFLFKGTTLPDPDPALTPKQVAQRYAHQFPELVAAEPLPAKVVEGVEIIEFKENFGTKG
jgi:PRTRC genetic system protein C